MRRASLILPLLLSCWLLGCVGAMRVPERTRAEQGATDNVDLSFMKAGTISRAEVVEKLKAVDTGFRSDHFFVGRWCSSKWAAWAGFAYQGPGVLSGGRMWHGVNLVVEFDEQGVVKSFEVFPSKVLPAKLAPVSREATVASGEEIVAAGASPVDLRQLTHLILAPESLKISQVRNHKNLSYKVPADEVLGVTPGYGPDDNPGRVEVDLHFAHDLRQFGGPGGNKLHLQVTVPQAIVLLRYASDHQEPSPSN